MQQQVAEIDGVQGSQPLLIRRVELGAAVVVGRGFGRRAPCRASARGSSSRRSGRPACRAGQRFSSMLAATISCFSSRIWSSVSRMVKFGFSPTSSAWRRRILRRQRMEGAQPGHPLDRLAQQPADAVLHLARGLVGEGHGENLVRPRACRWAADARSARSAPWSCRCPPPPASAPGRPAPRPPRAGRGSGRRDRAPARAGHGARRQRHRRRLEGIAVVEGAHRAQPSADRRAGKGVVPGLFARRRVRVCRAGGAVCPSRALPEGIWTMARRKWNVARGGSVAHD